jgi:hypothetical protein
MEALFKFLIGLFKRPTIEPKKIITEEPTCPIPLTSEEISERKRLGRNAIARKRYHDKKKYTPDVDGLQ